MKAKQQKQTGEDSSAAAAPGPSVLASAVAAPGGSSGIGGGGDDDGSQGCGGPNEGAAAANGALRGAASAGDEVPRLLSALMQNPQQLQALRLLLGAPTNAALPPLRPFALEPDVEPPAVADATSFGLARAVLEGRGQHAAGYGSEHRSLRIAMKLFNRTPADLPPDLRQQVVEGGWRWFGGRGKSPPAASWDQQPQMRLFLVNDGQFPPLCC